MKLKAGVNRRHFLKSAAAIPVFAIGCSPLSKTSARRTASGASVRRVRPGDPAWPSAASWERLSREVEGRLIKVQSPLTVCQNAGSSGACSEVLRKLKNPFYIGDEPGLTQNLGWIDAWTSTPSIYAVAAAKTEDVVAAVNFAREHNLRLVVKGGGHSYQGTSNSPDSLLIWTRRMNSIELHDSFVGEGCAPEQAPQPAATVGAGAIWMQAYEAVTTKGGRYVQGGGCTTVGVAGLIQSGGFGSFSKNYGLAAAGLLEAEVVTADGTVRIANPCKNADLFWGIKGGGGGTLGVVTRVTLRTRELPNFVGGVFGTIRSKSDSAFRKLIARTVSFYRDRLFNRHWGEQIIFQRNNSVRISMVFQGLDRQEVADVWRPFFDWVADSPQEFSIDKEVMILDLPARDFWNAESMRKAAAGAIVSDDRPGAAQGHFFWAGDGDQAGEVVHGCKSAWLPASGNETYEIIRRRLFQALDGDGEKARDETVKAFHELYRKNAAEFPPEAREARYLELLRLAIIATGGPAAFPGIPGHEPDVAAARRHAREIDKAMDALLKVAPSAGSYVSESDFFERSWQESFWGSNYPRLAAVKKKYDPTGLFFVHHGVGSGEWSADGFTRLRGTELGQKSR